MRDRVVYCAPRKHTLHDPLFKKDVLITPNFILIDALYAVLPRPSHFCVCNLLKSPGSLIRNSLHSSDQWSQCSQSLQFFTATFTAMWIHSSQRSENNSLSLHNSFKKYIRKSWTNAFRNKPDLTFSKIYYLHPNAEGIHLRSFPKSCETPGIMANSYPFSAAFYLAQLFFWFCADEWKRDTAQWISLIPGSVSKAQGDSSWPSEHRIQLLTE